MKTYICLMCGEHGCKLEVGEEAQKPVACPYGFTRDETRWAPEDNQNE